MASEGLKRIDIERPRYDQGTYIGRAKHFLIITNPLNILATRSRLEKAKSIVEKHRANNYLTDLPEDDLWRAKQLYDSAYHPDTKEKMPLLGRMSATVPTNMTVTGLMMTFHKGTYNVIFWQWANQTYNAFVNYTNANKDKPISLPVLGISYTLATGGAVGTALYINSFVQKFPPLIGRFVPFVAVAAANCINIPCMRSKELVTGIPVYDENGNRLCLSKRAAVSAISKVVFSRVMIAVPAMVIPPFIMDYLDRKQFLRKMPWLNAPVQILLVGAFLALATPFCCAIFPQNSSLKVSSLEQSAREAIAAQSPDIDRVYFNKGL